MPSVRYQPAQEDFLAACRLNHLSRITGWAAAAFLVAYTVGVYALVRYSDGPADVALVLAGATGSIFVGILVIIHLVRPRHVARRQFWEQRNLRDPYTLEWDEQGYAIRGPTVTSAFPWDHYVYWREDRRVILLYQSGYHFQFVPKRLLSPSEVEFIRDRLRAAYVPRVRWFLA